MKKTITLIALMLASFTFSMEARAESPESPEITACKQARKEYSDWIKEKYAYIWQQDWVKRCATYSRLISLYESAHLTSIRCINTHNCHGMKIPGNKGAKKWINMKRNTWNFAIFEKRSDSYLLFARLYARFNMKKPASVFVSHWSETDQNTYIAFLRANYWKTYYSF